MNKRIKELIEESTNRFLSADNKFDVRFDKEKFAQLIIEDCAQLCKDTAEKQFNPLYNRESDGAMACYKKLKEYLRKE